MILNANDFDCVPDGRFLERASMTAGSPILTDPDGVFRPTDVGKNIAVPGAIDLVTTIARLLEHREVRNATMDAGSNELSGTLFDPEKKAGEDEERFRADLHVGRRITVEGAGPNGGMLVSDIVDVLGATTILLADTAQASVSGTRVIVNRPDRVALADYARRTADPLTIDLGDRSIGDGKVNLGGRGLVSASAKFSSLDLGKQVTIQGAGLLVTHIRSFTNSQQVVLDAAAQHSVEEVVADAWLTDSRPAFDLLLAAIDAMPGEPAEIVFGPGVYDFTRPPGPATPTNAAIGLKARKNLNIRGAGLGVTVLRLMPNQDLAGPDTHVIETIDCTRLTLRDLSVHGAYLTMARTNEQMHGIFL